MRAATESAWRSSTFARAADRIEWRVDGAVVQLRHAGHLEEGTLTFTLPEWRAFVAAAQTGQAGSVAY